MRADYRGVPDRSKYTDAPHGFLERRARQSARQGRKRIAKRFARAGEKAVDPIFADPGRRPAIDQAMGQPYQEVREHAGEYDVGEEMRAGGDAQHADACTEEKRRAIGNDAQLRRRQRRRRQRPERAGRLAGDERAIIRAVAARIPPRPEMIVAAELLHVDRPRPVPMVFENEIGENARSERQGGDQEQCGPAFDQHPPPRQDELADDGDESRQYQKRDDQARRFARVLHPRLGVDVEHGDLRDRRTRPRYRDRAADRRRR